MRRVWVVEHVGPLRVAIAFECLSRQFVMAQDRPAVDDWAFLAAIHRDEKKIHEPDRLMKNVSRLRRRCGVHVGNDEIRTVAPLCPMKVQLPNPVSLKEATPV